MIKWLIFLLILHSTLAAKAYRYELFGNLTYGLYYIPLYLGSDRIRQDLIPDTGSSILTISCSTTCVNCETKHKSKYYNPLHSLTSRTLTCVILTLKRIVESSSAIKCVWKVTNNAWIGSDIWMVPRCLESSSLIRLIFSKRNNSTYRLTFSVQSMKPIPSQKYRMESWVWTLIHKNLPFLSGSRNYRSSISFQSAMRKMGVILTSEKDNHS